MQRAADIISARIASQTGLDDERQAVVAYGLFAIIQTIVTLALVGLAGAIAGEFAASIAFCLAGATLRRFSGGAHAPGEWSCLAVSVAVCTLGAVATAVVCQSSLLAGNMILAALGVASLASVGLFAPVQTQNKPIPDFRRATLRKGALAIVIAALAICVAGAMFAPIRRVSVALLLGCAWQSVTLTPIFRRATGFH